jgi:ABC-2 type transport system permease protein
MVATLLRLRFRVLGNQLSRSVWQLIGFIFGAVYGLGVLSGAVIGLVFLGFGSPVLASAVIVGAGSLVTLGWVLGSFIGIDNTLDPERLVVFPMTLRRMMTAIVLAGVCGIPGIVTSVAALATLATWVHWPAAALVSLITLPVAVLTAVIASRTVASLASGMGGKRRLREASGVLVFIPLILAGPIIAGVATGFAVNLDTVGVVVRVLGWTPIGAAWAVPADVASGDWIAAAAKLVIALATLALLWLLWGWSLRAALAHPRQQASAQVKPGRIGWFGRVPATATGAVFARSLTYWIRDPRYLRQLIGVPLVPVLLWFYLRGGDPAVGLSFTAPILALVVGIVIYADISYDGTAFATEVATGASGRADRLGRTLAAGTIGLPIVLIAAVLPFFFSGRWEQLPGILGMSLGILLTSYGVCAVTSAQLVVPVASAGDNPFKRVPGTTMLQGMSFLLIWLIAIFTGDAVLSLVAGGLGLVLGGVFFTVGVRVGGRMLDRSAPVLLARLRAMKNA